MEKYFALINNNLVEHVVVGNDNFIEHVKNQYDTIVDVTDEQRPAQGDSYYPQTKQFISNSKNLNMIDVNLPDRLKQGTNDGFEPFQLSKYSVSYSNGVVAIGCKQYSAVGLLDALDKVLISDEAVSHCFITGDAGPAHGKFGITWDDAQKLYDALIKVKL